jgi:hypothetical protein
VQSQLQHASHAQLASIQGNQGHSHLMHALLVQRESLDQKMVPIGPVMGVWWEHIHGMRVKAAVIPVQIGAYYQACFQAIITGAAQGSERSCLKGLEHL